MTADVIAVAIVEMGQVQGVTSFAAEAQPLTRLGVPGITAFAECVSNLNGYSTWPTLGYKTPLDANTLRNIRVTNAFSVQTRSHMFSIMQRGETPTLHDLIATTDRLCFGQRHGVSSEMSFTLIKGSADRQWLTNYLRARRRDARPFVNPARWR